MIRTANVLFVVGLLVCLVFWPLGALMILAAVVLWLVARGPDARQPTGPRTVVVSSSADPGISRTTKVVMVGLGILVVVLAVLAVLAVRSF